MFVPVVHSKALGSGLYGPAGYGRLGLTELLLSRGADIDALNNKKQKAVDVAKMNGEVSPAVTVTPSSGLRSNSCSTNTKQQTLLVSQYDEQLKALALQP